MKYLIAILFSCVLNYTSTAQTTKQIDAKLELAINKVMQCFETGDSKGLQELIHPEIGVVVLYRIGATNRYLLSQEFEFKKEGYYYEMNLGSTKKLNYFEKTEPQYDCDNFSYPKKSEGIYVNKAETKGYNLLSSIVALNDEFEKDANKQMWNFAKTLEHYGVRVTVVGLEGHANFYMVLKDEIWYFCMYDTITTDCSA